MSEPTPPPPPGGPEVPPTAGPGVPPPPPSMPPPPPGSLGAAPQNGMGTAALVMGILQFVCLGPIASILAVIFGKIGMNKAKQGLATNGGVAKAGFWLGIAGLILSVIGIILSIILIAAGVIFVNNSIDPANNSKTGLSDGNYAMEPNSSLHINNRCSFGGYPINLDTMAESSSSVTVVGEGSTQCGRGSGTPDAVLFTVTGGVAKIVEVND